MGLLFAYKPWGDKNYLTQAKEIINDIWQHEIVKVNGHYYMLSAANSKNDDGYLINPSYCSPAAYHIFANVDPKHSWNSLAKDCYYLLNKLGAVKDNKTYLPPNWIYLNKANGEIASASKYIKDADSYNYGFDSFRVMWRVALDAEWFNNHEAFDYLKKVVPFFAKQWLENNKYSAIYDLAGKKQVDYSSLSTEVAPLSVFAELDKPTATEIYTKLFEKKFNYEEGYWGNKNNYYDQNWAWFGTALYTDSLPNLWTDKK